MPKPVHRVVLNNADGTQHAVDFRFRVSAVLFAYSVGFARQWKYDRSSLLLRIGRVYLSIVLLRDLVRLWRTGRGR